MKNRIENKCNGNEICVEEEFQAEQWRKLLARDRAVGRYPEMHAPVIGPTKALPEEFYIRFRNADQHTEIYGKANNPKDGAKTVFKA